LLEFYVHYGVGCATIHIGVAILSILIAAIGGRGFSFLALIIYALIGPTHGVYWAIMGKRLERLKEGLTIKESSGQQHA
jgi:hypothetical protein